jgi:hypothetical protein
LSLKWRKAGQEAADKLKSAGNPTDLSARARRKSGKISGRSVSGYQKVLRSDSRWRRPLRDKGELEVVDDTTNHREVGKEGDDLHRALPPGAEQRIDLVHFSDHLGPASGRDGPELVLNNP